MLLGASGEASFDITLYDNPFVNKWVQELQWCLQQCNFNNKEISSRFDSLDDSIWQLEQACLTINKYLKNFIEIKTDLKNQPQEYFNYLHEIFEKLSGNFNHPTKLFAVANNELKTAIRDLNSYIHLVEKKKKATYQSYFYISFDKNAYRRHPITEDEHDYFKFAFPAGTLYLHYVELGKNFLDLYEDGLTVDYQGFKNLHYYSGEASLALYDYNAFADNNYLKWLSNQNINPYDKSYGHGQIPLGKIDGDIEQLRQIIFKYPTINKITINDE